ncbi:IPT/TIG domain-containing protein [Pedobacter jeongneungensis]|uniref:IPT/TIG domain-containing protein n=1 Tax=Pedobacter jeongneungensis TaxID=947309 RepID=UPI0004684566|nr:IPT/TIG domain-containing protein [Pedobacter jeongneungensis]
MKRKYYFLKHALMPVFSILFLAAFFSACKKENTDSASPVLTSVTTLTDRNTGLSNATYSQWILIRGRHLASANQVDFNGTLISRDMIFANDTSITVQVPGPLAGATSNPITVTTAYGQATLAFNILQPAPVIGQFSPVSGSVGDVVTITGDWFTNLESVKFGTVAATVVSSSKTEIKVRVPAGGDQSYIFVTTSGGTSRSANIFGFKYIIYDDALNTSWWSGGWGGTTNYASTEVVKRGLRSIRVNYVGGWGSPIQIGGGNLATAGYTAIKISIYGGSGSNNNKVKLILNGSASSGQELILTEGKWTDYNIPLSTLGNPTAINEIWLQEFSNGATTLVYVDDLGLI